METVWLGHKDGLAKNGDAGLPARHGAVVNHSDHDVHRTAPTMMASVRGGGCNQAGIVQCRASELMVYTPRKSLGSAHFLLSC
jgi:hypothetical protein